MGPRIGEKYIKLE